MTQVYDAPLWFLESITLDEIRISLAICELPNNILLHQIDHLGNFRPAVINQIMPIVNTLLKGVSKNKLMMANLDNTKFLKKIKSNSDEEILLILFQKHYKGSTQTSCVVINSELVKSKPKLIQKLHDCNITNKYFKGGKVVIKYDMKMYINGNGLFFGIQRKKANSIQ